MVLVLVLTWVIKVINRPGPGFDCPGLVLVGLVLDLVLVMALVDHVLSSFRSSLYS